MNQGGSVWIDRAAFSGRDVSCGSMPLATKTRLGPYEVITLLGAGGMGEVYEARDTRLDRIVAIKICKGGLTERFEREARAISSLNHQHICALYDIGCEDSVEFLVMEYLEAETLEGKEADTRSDVFSFEAMFYEMVTGRKTFDGSSYASLIAAVMAANPPPVSTIQPMASPAGPSCTEVPCQVAGRSMAECR